MTAVGPRNASVSLAVPRGRRDGGATGAAANHAGRRPASASVTPASRWQRPEAAGTAALRERRRATTVIDWRYSRGCQ